MPCWAALLFLTIYWSSAWAKTYTVDEKRKIVEQATREFLSSPQLFYAKVLTDESYSGFAVPNELSHYLLPMPPAGDSGLLVGVGTLINFNIAANRKNTGIIFSDLDSDVLLAIRNLWRTLMLASDSPRDFLLNLTLADLPNGASVNDVFAAYRKGNRGSLTQLNKFTVRLDELVARGLITTAAKDYTLAAITDSLQFHGQAAKTEPFSDGPFVDPEVGHDLVRRALFLYDPFIIKMALRMNSVTPGVDVDNKLDQTTFLETNRYRYLQALFLNNFDFYARGDISSAALWEAISQQAQRRNLSITDIYLSNVRTHLRKGGKWLDVEFGRVLRNTFKTTKPFVYDSIGTGDGTPFEYTLSQICQYGGSCEEVAHIKSTPFGTCQLNKVIKY